MPPLQVEPRDAANTKPKALRRQGLLPMALTRRDHTTLELQAPMTEVRNAARGADEHGRFELRLPGQDTIKVIIKHQEIDFVHGQPLHIALQEVGDEDVVRLDIPVVAIGTPPAVADGEAMLVQPTDHVKLRGRMKDLPEKFETDVSHLEVGDSIHASDLIMPEGIELMSAPEATLFIVQVQKAVEEAPAVAAEEIPVEGELPAGDTEPKEEG